MTVLRDRDSLCPDCPGYGEELTQLCVFKVCNWYLLGGWATVVCFGIMAGVGDGSGM